MIYGEVNVGVAVARDTAIKATSTDYVCMLDADDYFFSNKKIESEMQKAQQIYNETGKKVAVFSQTVDVDENGIPFLEPGFVDLEGNERFRIVTRLYSNYISRFARNTVDAISAVRKLAQLKHLVGVLFETENLYTLDQTSEIILTVLSAVAQEESHIKSEIMNGRRSRYAQHRRPRAPPRRGRARPIPFHRR